MSAPPSNACRASASACVRRRSNRCRGSLRRWAVRNCTSSVTTWPAAHSAGTRRACSSTCWARRSPKGATAVVGGSAAQSNYSRQLAAACARLGLDCHLVLRAGAPGRRTAAGFAAPRSPLRRDDRARRRRPGGADPIGSPNVPTHSNATARWCTGPRKRARSTNRCTRRPTPARAVEMLEQAAAAGIDPTHVYVLVTRHHPRRPAARPPGGRVDDRACAPSRRTNGRSSPTARSRTRWRGWSTAAGHLLGLAVPITAARRVDIDRARRSAIRRR